MEMKLEKLDPAVARQGAPKAFLAQDLFRFDRYELFHSQHKSGFFADPRSTTQVRVEAVSWKEPGNLFLEISIQSGE